MADTDIRIDRLDVSDVGDASALASLLVDAVEDNAGISFMAGLTPEEAEQWWQERITGLPERAVLLVARDRSGIVGTVQMQPAWAPNQPHRADITKLIVHRRSRGRGIARELMEAVEQYALTEDITLLVLDTCSGGAAEQLYLSLGWRRVGVIPRFALNPDGSECDTVFFYKDLGAS